MNRSGLTAIKRKKMSAPVRYLLSTGTIDGAVLDYGCGHGKDVHELKGSGFWVTGYDPNQEGFKQKPQGKFKTILCTYVLNVVDASTREEILKDIYKYLNNSGKAYITVRRDIKEDYISSKGTHQYKVKLNLPVVKENSNFCIYLMER